jgi:hypothetical protein
MGRCAPQVKVIASLSRDFFLGLLHALTRCRR